MREFTDDDKGKAVVDSEGNQIGTVTEIRENTPFVELEDRSNIRDRIIAALGWDDSKDLHSLSHADIDSVSRSEIRLRSL